MDEIQGGGGANIENIGDDDNAEDRHPGPAQQVAVIRRRALSPTEVFHQLMGVVERRDHLAALDLYAEDVRLRHPFFLPEPTDFHSREELRKYFANRTELPVTGKTHNVVVHETTDPEVVIGECDYLLTAKESGKSTTVANIFVLRVRDGKILESRDYHNHAAINALIHETHR